MQANDVAGCGGKRRGSQSEGESLDVTVKTVILGEAYIERNGTAGKADRFVCLLGDKGCC